MLSAQLKTILVVAVAIALEVPEISGLKCYACRFAALERKANPICITPSGEFTGTSDVGRVEWGQPHCEVTLYYNKTAGSLPVYTDMVDTVERGVGYYKPEKYTKNNGFVVLPECSDAKKFPKPILYPETVTDDNGVESQIYVHTCFCPKDLCNSAVASHK